MIVFYRSYCHCISTYIPVKSRKIDHSVDPLATIVHHSSLGDLAVGKAPEPVAVLFPGLPGIECPRKGLGRTMTHVLA